MPTNVEFDILPICLRFITQVGGSLLEMHGLELSAEQASRIAYLVNQQKELKVEVKVKE